MDEIYQRVFLKDSKACCQPRIINGCTGIIRSVDTEEKEQKKKNSQPNVSFQEIENIAQKVPLTFGGVTLLWQDILPEWNQ